MGGSSSDLFGPGGAVGDIVGGVGDLFTASGYKAAAKAYQQGSIYAKQNAQIAGETEKIQQVQAQRNIEQTIGAEKADVGGAGLASGGSAQYLLKSSLNQAAMTKQLISLQGAINVNAYNEEATAMEGQAASAEAAAKASTAGGIGSIIAGIGEAAMFFVSDARLKRELHLEGRRKDGIGIWTFEYVGDPTHTRYMGVLAQEVYKVHPEAIDWTADGYMTVNYDAIGAHFGQVGHA